MNLERKIIVALIIILPSFYIFSYVAEAGNDLEIMENTFAQEARDRYTAEEVRQDLLIPTSPAFGVLGVTPEEVIRPDTPRALGAALLNGVDSEGNLQSGIAIDFSPVFLFGGRHDTLSDYRRNYQTRLANRTQLSIATTKGSDENDRSMRLALGMRMALIDKADPRSSQFLDACYAGNKPEVTGGRSKIKQGFLDAQHQTTSLTSNFEKIEFSLMKIRSQIDEAVLTPRPGNSSLGIEEMEDLLKDFPEKKSRVDRIVDLKILSLSQLNHLLELVLRKKIVLETEVAMAEGKETNLLKQLDAILDREWQICNDAWQKQNWNATNVSVGFAPIFFSEKGDFGDLNGSGIAVYGTVSYGFDGISRLEDLSQVILHARYRTNEKVANPKVTGNFIEQDLLVLGGQLRIAGPDYGNRIGGKDLAFYGELDYRFSDPEGQGNDTSIRYAFGMDLKVMEDVTLSLTVGDESGDAVGASRSFAVGNMKWAF